jgi:hypothetical protein
MAARKAKAPPPQLGMFAPEVITPNPGEQAHLKEQRKIAAVARRDAAAARGERVAAGDAAVIDAWNKAHPDIPPE